MSSRRQLTEIWFRWRNGYWCADHVWENRQHRTDGSGWEMIDCGMRQMRICSLCKFMETR